MGDDTNAPFAGSIQ